MKIGIITPLYNDEKRIAKAMKSVQRQKGDFEIRHYICDDMSTDNSYQTAIKHGNPSVRLFQTEQNSGPSAARNICISEVLNDTVDYIAFLDSDDIWNSNHLNLLVENIGDSDFICSLATNVDVDGNELVSYGMNMDDDFSINGLLNGGNKIHISSVLIKLDVLKKVGYFDSLCDSLEDWDYWLRISKSGFKMKRIHEKTITYLVRNGSMAEKSRNAKYVVKSKYEDLKLNLGSGEEYLDDYVNCDLYDSNTHKVDMIFDAKKIPFHDNSIEEIRAYHLIEHFNYMEIWDILNEWHRVLKPNGRLVLETPDLLNTCKKFVEADEQTRVILYGHFFAWPWIDGQTHYFLFTETQLSWTLNQIGFTNVTRKKADSIYARSTPPDWNSIYLKMIARK